MSISFGGDTNTKIGTSLTTNIERKFINFIVPLLPSWLKSYHLTLATIPISALILLFSYLGHSNIQWLWIVSFLIAMQWFTDSIDGTLGKARKEGLIQWGFYMDHLLDYFFLASILIGYILVFPDIHRHLQFFVLALFGGYMAHCFLAFGATNEFRITFLGIGPTEIRLAFILTNTLLIFFGKIYFTWLIPYLLLIGFIVLCILVYQTQKRIWQLDSQNKS